MKNDKSLVVLTRDFFYEMFGLNCFDVGIPGTIDSIFHGLIGRAKVRIDIKGSLGLL